MVREEFPSARLIVSSDNEGIAGWNRAFAAGRGDWFLVLDDDCFVEGDALELAVAGAAEHGADMVSFRVDSSEPGPSFSDVYRTGLLSFWGCAVLISRRAIEDLGGFDRRLFIWAHELEFTMRFLDRGHRHLHLPEVTAVHMKAVSPVVPANHMRNMRNWAYIATKLLRPRDAVFAVASLLARSVIETFVAPAYLRGFRAVMGGAREGLRVRRPVRPAVSRLYRRHFVEFTSQFRPGPRLRYLLFERSEPRTNFREAFWRSRPRLYPGVAASVHVP
jgi:GT2 family glycosyltransferase